MHRRNRSRGFRYIHHNRPHQRLLATSPGQEKQAANQLHSARQGHANTVASLHDESGTMRVAQEADYLCGGIREFLQIGCLPSVPKREEFKIARQAQTCFMSEALVWHTLKRNKQRTRHVLLVPASMRQKILQAAHSSWVAGHTGVDKTCLLYTSPSPRDKRQSRMPSSA